jgi:DNA mismatch repair protein MutS
MALTKDYFLKTQQYIKDYGENTILLMQVGAFFEVYGLKTVGSLTSSSSYSISGSKIQDFSRICDLNIVEKKICVGADEVVMAGFKDIMLEKYIKKIQDADFTAVVYIQDQQAKNTTRSLLGIFSPGTYFAPESQQITNNTVCIWIQSVKTSPFFSRMLPSSKTGPKTSQPQKMVYVGVANIDIYTGRTNIFEFNEQYIDNPTTFDELERFISIYKPSEAIIISNLMQTEVDNIINYANIQCGLIHVVLLNESTIQTNAQICAANCEKQIYQKELLQRFYKMNDYQVFMQNFYDYTIATQAFCYLLDFIYQHNPRLVNKLEEPVFENYGERLILANHSLKQLNIIDDKSYSGKYSSVSKLLNVCITPMGKRKFNYVFLNPTTNCISLKCEYDITEHILQKYTEYEEIVKEPLTSMKDISKLVRQIVMRRITPKSVSQFYTTLVEVKKIYLALSGDKTTMKYLMKEEKSQNYTNTTNNISQICDQLTKFIDDHFILSMCHNIDIFHNFDINFIQRNIDETLDNNMRTLMESTDSLETCKNYLNMLVSKYEKSPNPKAKPKPKAKSSTPVKEDDNDVNNDHDNDNDKSSDYVKIHETEKNNFSLISTKRRCKVLKEQLPSNSASTISLSYVSSFTNIINIFEFKNSQSVIEFTEQTASNNIITSFQIKELCKNVSSVKVQMKDIISTVYLSIIGKLEVFQEEIGIINQFISQVDMLYAKAHLAKKFNYCKPIIDETTDKSFINVHGLRHGLIEHIQKDEIYVSNNISLGCSEDGIMLYGTNAVGKTSFIRAIGIAVIMAQAGLYVPASSFIYKPYNYIFTRILGNDNIFKGLSTFAVEMSELRTILRLANKDSLVLGDELCSGTESISATSIFVAGIQRLHEIGCSFIFATHLHEIIKYDEIAELSRLSLKHMEVIYDREKDLLIYDRKLRDGPGTNMYGLEVCKSLSLPEDFLQMANNIRMKYNPESASILGLKTSHYSAKKVVGMCEQCGETMGTEVHHLQHQHLADKNGLIQNKNADLGAFHKNHPANLMTVCEKCHTSFHLTNNEQKNEQTKMHKRVKTSKGTKILPL